jgi:Flp pilus assembly protein TadG
MTPSPRASRSAASGQATVEFAAAIVIALVVLFILADWGRVVFAQNAVTQAAREGVRVGAVGAQLTTSKYQQIRDATLALAPGVGFTAADIVGDPPTDPDAPPGCADPGALDPYASATCFYPDSNCPQFPQRVVVNVTAEVEPLSPILPFLLMVVGDESGIDTITVSARSVGTIQDRAPCP